MGLKHLGWRINPNPNLITWISFRWQCFCFKFVSISLKIMEQEEISQFYDDFVEAQVKTGANERLISLYKRLFALGLQSDSKILELGCGVGAFTKLLSRRVKKGVIEAVDLSEKSIEAAQKLFSDKENIILVSADVVKYTPQNRDFNFVTLMDVIEHIPLNQHGNLFRQISTYTNENSLVCINIPNPEYIEYTRVHEPEKLQILDQSVQLLPLLQHLEGVGFELIFFEKYSIWVREDYHFLVFRKRFPFELRHLKDERKFSEKVINKIERNIDRLRYS